MEPRNRINRRDFLTGAGAVARLGTRPHVEPRQGPIAMVVLNLSVTPLPI
jgi:hypothetical protein